MVKIKDHIALGMISGVVGGLAGLAIEYPLYRKGLATSTWTQQATGATIQKDYHKAAGARLLGFVTTMAVSGLFGVGQTYLYSITGKDHASIKSISYGLVAWLGIHGLGTRATYAFRQSDPLTSALSLVSNLMSSACATIVILKLGDESLFPSQPSTSHSDGTTDVRNYDALPRPASADESTVL